MWRILRSSSQGRRPALASSLALAVLAASGLSLSACDDDESYRVGVGWGTGPYAYDGWYDGYYGPVYDGYWGDDGFFYYRGYAGQGYRRGGGEHFRREAGAGSNFQQFHGSVQMQQGMRMPHFPRGDRHRDR